MPWNDEAIFGPVAGKNIGVVTMWDDDPAQRYGFIRDETGTDWCVLAEDLPGGRESLPVGTRVAFTGPPIPVIGGYPHPDPSSLYILPKGT